MQPYYALLDVKFSYDRWVYPLYIMLRIVAIVNLFDAFLVLCVSNSFH